MCWLKLVVAAQQSTRHTGCAKQELADLAAADSLPRTRRCAACRSSTHRKYCQSQSAGRPAGVCRAMRPCRALQVFVELGLITAAEMEDAIVSEFNPVRWGSVSCCRAELPAAVNGAQVRLLQAVQESCSCVQGRAPRQRRDCNDRRAELWSVPNAPAGECEAALLGSWRVSFCSAGTALPKVKGPLRGNQHPT